MGFSVINVAYMWRKCIVFRFRFPFFDVVVASIVSVDLLENVSYKYSLVKNGSLA